jgi:serine/threonine-protein kinase Chk2
LELAVGGELFGKIIQETKFNETEAKLHFYQIVSRIQYLHSRKITHRDLKPENILLCSEDDSNPIIKITDMGLSKLVGYGTVCKTFCGTPLYLAPEVLISRVRGTGTYDFKVDMWS